MLPYASHTPHPSPHIHNMSLASGTPHTRMSPTVMGMCAVCEWLPEHVRGVRGMYIDVCTNLRVFFPAFSCVIMFFIVCVLHMSVIRPSCPSHTPNIPRIPLTNAWHLPVLVYDGYVMWHSGRSMGVWCVHRDTWTNCRVCFCLCYVCSCCWLCLAYICLTPALHASNIPLTYPAHPINAHDKYNEGYVVGMWVASEASEGCAMGVHGSMHEVPWFFLSVFCVFICVTVCVLRMPPTHPTCPAHTHHMTITPHVHAWHIPVCECAGYVMGRPGMWEVCEGHTWMNARIFLFFPVFFRCFMCFLLVCLHMPSIIPSYP